MVSVDENDVSVVVGNVIVVDVDSGKLCVLRNYDDNVLIGCNRK